MEENLKQKHTEILKIALYGPDSTGKTTLAKQLAAHFNTVFVPEYAKTYLQEKNNTKKQELQVDDLLTVAIGQINLENQALEDANKYLFCDTNIMSLKVFSETNYNNCNRIIDVFAQTHNYDLIFLTDIYPIDEQNKSKEIEDTTRKKMFSLFEKSLIDANKAYLKLSGSKEQRFAQAIKIIEDFNCAKQLGFNNHDYIQLLNRNINLEVVENQFQILKTGIPKINLERPAAINDGIIPLTKEDASYFAGVFEKKKNDLKLKKFVPASGAASRMFKFLSTFLAEFKPEEESINAYINRKKDNDLSVFLVGLEKFPFYKTVEKKVKTIYPDYKNWSKDEKDYAFIKTLLSKEYFDFVNKPKGVLPFHQYKSHTATAIEEHLKECVSYASSNNKSHLHFTISEIHQSSFEKIIEKIKPKIEEDAKIKIEVKYSYQNQSTDVVAVGIDNTPFRDANSQIVFRPGGHGALIENLNNLFADIVFIKNIDNVNQNHTTINALYKKALAGVLIETQETIFNYIQLLKNNAVSKEKITEMVDFITLKLNSSIVEDFFKYTEKNKIDYLTLLLDRPIRVCGMVKNEGEPGGGPFWIRDKKGNSSLQIIESSQIDATNLEQLAIFQKSTHFNPVDLVCGIKNSLGQPFDLKLFVDKNTGFIVDKTKDGKPLRAFELPGLWNGAMAKWITLFVEVPLSTFSPVKTVNDLLKSAHQSID